MLEANFTEVIPIKMPDGSVLHAEVTRVGTQDVGVGRTLRLDQARDALWHMGCWAVETVKNQLPRPPDVFEMEFGMKLGMEAGELVAILAKASGEASIAVRMTWSRESLEAMDGGVVESEEHRH
ncbi:CU044_2847 family protein [Streptomyces sp. NPDC127106]|uniref:CU044_2847 family protein n=1 Tax=Streptomyces sp. NPDC127106 TaxID=3345360 RepID=UPI00362FF837